MKHFWKNMNDHINGFEKETRVVIMGDMNAKVECDENIEIVGKWGVPGVNENGSYFVEVCAERYLFLANTFFQHKMIQRYI